MSSALVDTNVLIDVLTDSQWGEWAAQQIATGLAEGNLVINQVVFAELAAGDLSLEDMDELLPPQTYFREDLPWEAAYLAGRAFANYRRGGGPRTSVLPDFLIGAHAAVKGYRLVTRDARRFRTHFPTVEIVAPSS